MPWSDGQYANFTILMKYINIEFLSFSLDKDNIKMYVIWEVLYLPNQIPRRF